MGLYDEIAGAVQTSESNSISSIVTGVVKENWNEKFPGKVKVELFLSEAGKNVTGWASVMSPYAGEGYGGYFLPEVGAEVVVAFSMGDRNCPVVLGCLWNGKNKLPEKTAEKDNFTKLYQTKGGCKILLNDKEKKQKIEIQTGAGTGIEIDDENQKITIHDEKSKNKILLDSKKGSITVEAEKKLILKAGGAEVAVFDGTGKKADIKTGTINISADTNLKMKCVGLTAEGTNVTIKGSAQVSAQSSGPMQIKGAIVKIN